MKPEWFFYGITYLKPMVAPLFFSSAVWSLAHGIVIPLSI